MALRRRASMSQFPLVIMAVVVATAVIRSVRANLDQDRAECADQLVGLAGCLPYVGGDAKAPTVDCCTGLKDVIAKSRKCLCVLIKDRDDPQLGLKINATLALGLPDTCHAPANITECVDLLHLDPKSKDAKIFEGYTKSNGTTTSTTTPAAKAPAAAATGANSTSTGSSNGSREKKMSTRVAFGVTCGAVLWVFKSNLRFYV